MAIQQYDLNKSLWGNTFVFPLALESVLNNVGMLLLMDMFQGLSYKTFTDFVRSSTWSSTRSRRSSKVVVVDVPLRNAVPPSQESKETDLGSHILMELEHLYPSSSEPELISSADSSIIN
jgi:hypothetical protein